MQDKKDAMYTNQEVKIWEYVFKSITGENSKKKFNAEFWFPICFDKFDL